MSKPPIGRGTTLACLALAALVMVAGCTTTASPTAPLEATQPKESPGIPSSVLNDPVYRDATRALQLDPQDSVAQSIVYLMTYDFHHPKETAR